MLVWGHLKIMCTVSGPSSRRFYLHIYPPSLTWGPIKASCHINVLRRNVKILIFFNTFRRYVLPTIQFSHTVKEFQVLLSITNNSFKHQLFVYSQLNDQTLLFLKIQFNIRHLFAHSLNDKHVICLHWVFFHSDQE